MKRLLTHSRPWLLTSLILLVLAACAPATTQQQTITLNSPEATVIQTTAELAYHRMEIGYLETGAYTTNVLVDLTLPQGVRWTIEGFAGNDYTLRFTSDEIAQYIWLVSPEGIKVIPAAS